MITVWSSTDILLHDMAVDLYDKGYRSDDRKYLAYAFPHLDEDTVGRLCDYLKDIEREYGRRF